MSGPIVRSGPTEQYSSNWEKAFGKRKKQDAKTTGAKKATKKAKKKKKKD